MIQLYKDDYFEYNGKKSNEICNLILCYIGENDEEIQNGVSRETSNSDNNGFVSVTNSKITFEITLVKMDEERNKIVGFTKDELFEINRWLLTPKEYKPLTQKEYTYYAIFKKGKKWYNNNELQTGYLKYEVELLPYCYSPFIEQTIKLSSNSNIKEFDIYNNSNINEDDIGLTLDVSILDDSDYLKIENLTNNTVMEFVDMSDDECKRFRIIGEDIYGNKIHILKSMIDEDYNLMRHTYVRKWIKLFYGNNRLRITSNGLVTVKIKYRNKMQIQ